MTRRTHAANILAVYFEQKGHILSASEYKKQDDTPIRFAAINKLFGSWNRMENIVRSSKSREQRRAELANLTDVDEVIRRNAEEDAKYADKMREASEDLEAKAAREEAARLMLEEDKLRAATAEGAAENKKRKGGITSVSAKAQKEAVAQALAEEHAMLAKTAAGAALGKELLGGVEDNKEKTRVIEEQNAMREKTKLMAATPLGAAEAKLMEDDTDGQLTREAQARIRNELRLFVPPETEEQADATLKDAQAKVRDEVRDVVKEAKGDENVLSDAVFRATVARQRASKNLDAPVSLDDIPQDLVKTMPPADQPPAEGFAETSVEFKDKDGKVTHKLESPEDEGEEKDDKKSDLKVETKSESAKKASKLSEGEKKANKDNPDAPPATRNPDPNMNKDDGAKTTKK